MPTTKSIQSVIDGVHTELIRLNYSSSSICAYKRIWKQFVQHAEQRDQKNFSVEFAEAFMVENYDYPHIYKMSSHTAKPKIRKIRAIRSLQDFYAFGIIPSKFFPPQKPFPENFQSIYNEYVTFCTNEGYSAKTVILYTFIVKEIHYS